MRHLSYYCGDYINPNELKYIGHLAALEKKIEAGKKTISDLHKADVLEIDHYRIFRIYKALNDWQEEIKQMEEL